MKSIISSIFLLTLGLTAASQTWNQDIAPIFYDHCGKCHHDGGIGPMSLLTWTEASENSDDISDVILGDEMPPWPANPDYRHFLDENVLTDEEESAIINWVLNGSPEGSGSAPAAPSYNDGYLISDPDEIVAVPDYSVEVNVDEYRMFTIPSSSAVDRYIGAIEFEPGNENIVHHVLAFYDPSDISQQLDDATPEPGWTSSGGSFPSDEAELIGIWVPGMGPMSFPANLGMKVPAGADYVIQIHYAPGSQGQSAPLHMRLDYKEALFIREVWNDPFIYHFPPSLDEPLFIPANTVQSFHQESETAPIDLSFLSVFPHMHLLGKTYKIYGVESDGDTLPIVDVDNYDFHWQFNYVFPTLLKVSEGTVIHGEATYDNTENNDDNPSFPPQDVGLGEGTTDEMMIAFFNYTYYLPGDEDISMVDVQEAYNPRLALFAFPNPSRDQLLIDIPNHVHSIEQVRIYDSAGRAVSPAFDYSHGRMVLHTSDLPSGVYTVSILGEGNWMHTAFVKE